MLIETIFWLAIILVIYAYFGYPVILGVWDKYHRIPKHEAVRDDYPSVAVLIPAHNEQSVIKKKVENTMSLDYPRERLKLVIVSDGSTDDTAKIVQQLAEEYNIEFIEVKQRKGKANALNVGLEVIDAEIVVFSDSSIILDKHALKEVIRQFSDPNIGCISGEDHISGGGGEGLYGKYELSLRNQESRVGSIVGASGSFYAQRREICQPFLEGMAPDFLSVLNTVEQGYRAVSEPRAFGIMSATKSTQGEFTRKIRTLLRGMTTLWYKRKLMNPFRYGSFAYILLSHKLVRWLVPLFLLLAFLTNLLLLDSIIYSSVFVLQVIFYLFAYLAWKGIFKIGEKIYGKIPLYFCSANLAIVYGWVQFISGARQEIWEPTKRETD